MKYNISAEQCRAARQLLNWKASDLADTSGVTSRSISDFETGLRELRPVNMQSIVDAFEGAGVEFLPEGRGKGEGVRLREPRAANDHD